MFQVHGRIHSGKLRATEKQAREKKLRMWKDYTAAAVTMSVKEKNYLRKVRQIASSAICGGERKLMQNT